MEFEAAIAQGWKEHHQDPRGVADRLATLLGDVTDGDRAARYTALVNHAVGGELGEWDVALRLDRKAVSTVPPGPALVQALGNLAFAAYMAGDVVRSMSAQVRAAASCPAEAVPVFVRVNLLVADALMQKKRWDESLELFHDTLLLAETLPERSPADPTVALVCNNISSAMLDLPGRTAEQDALMERGARGARLFWLRTGDWRNDERSDYLLALVHNALGRHQEALAEAERGLETIRSNGGEPVDRAFLDVASAAALRGLGRTGESDARLLAAERLGSTFESSLKRWLLDGIAKVRAGG